MTTAVYLRSGEYLGLLDAHTATGLTNLLEEQVVRLQAFIAPQRKKSQQIRGGVPTLINIYGSERAFEAVGNILSENELFLQHPEGKEPHIDYKNPHFLTIPNISSSATIRKADEVVDEVTTLFEEVEHQELSQIEPGRGVKTPLLRYFYADRV